MKKKKKKITISLMNRYMVCFKARQYLQVFSGNKHKFVQKVAKKIILLVSFVSYASISFLQYITYQN